MDAKLQTIHELFKQYDVDGYESEVESRHEPDERRVPRELAEGGDAYGAIMSAVYGDDTPTVDLADQQDEIGVVGTRILDGYIRQEQTNKYRPIQVRGYWGHPGDFEDIYRQEVVVRDSIDSIVETQRSAVREVQAPDPELLPEQLHDEMSAWVDTLNAWWANIEPSSDNYVHNATTSVTQFGVAPFEVAWEVPGGHTWQQWASIRNADSVKPYVPMPWKLAFREPQTIDRWVMNDRGDTLLGATFQTGSEIGKRYFLPHAAEYLEDQRLILPRIAARGNNWEGISPIRPTMHWVKFKQLLGQIAAAAAQKYGVPTTYIRVDPALFEAVLGGDMQMANEVLDKMDAQQAVEAPIYVLPDGLMAETPSPPGQMPLLEDLLRYCDEMIARPFSNEGSLLGHNQTGSYALASVQENKWMRTAPAYDRVIMAPINDMIRRMTRVKFGQKLRAYPEMGMRLDSTTDTSSRMDDLVKANAGQPISQWPEAMQKQGLETLGMDPASLENDEPQAQAPENAADAGTLPATLARGHTDDEKRRASEILSSVDLAEYSERVQYCLQELSSAADGLQKFMDQSESQLADKWNTIANEQRKAFRDKTEGVDSAQALREVKRDLQDEYEDRYIAAARKQTDTLKRKGAAQLLRELGLTMPNGADVPELPATMREQLEANLISAASEVNNRNTSLMFDQRVSQITGGGGTSVGKLDKTTLRSVASKTTGRAFNAGRTAVVAQAKQGYESRTGEEIAGKSDPQSPESTTRGARKIKAFRSTMLDSDVCEECARLEMEEYIYGSSAYYADHPPEPCLGGGRCRCVMIHEVPEDMEVDFENAVLPTPF